MRAAAIAILIASGCDSGDELRCDDDSGRGNVACYASRVFAARDPSALVPAEADVERYYVRWLAIGRAEPVLALRSPQRYQTEAYQFGLTTRNPALIDAWLRQEIITGDPVVDATLAPLGIDSVRGSHSEDDGAYRFGATFQVMFNETLFDAQLRAIESRLPDPVSHPFDDGTWLWSGETATIDFHFGWGDCFVGCEGYRDLRAVVSDDLQPVVYDLGGDPLPDYIRLSPSTRPAP